MMIAAEGNGHSAL